MGARPTSRRDRVQSTEQWSSTRVLLMPGDNPAHVCAVPAQSPRVLLAPTASGARRPLIPMEVLAADWIAEHPVPPSWATKPLRWGLSTRWRRAAPTLSSTCPCTSDHRATWHRPAHRHPPGAGPVVGQSQLAPRSAAWRWRLLGQMVWESQRSGRPPDGEVYLETCAGDPSPAREYAGDPWRVGTTV